MIHIMLLATLFSLETPLMLQRADPWIWRAQDGMYYFTASVPQYDRIELRRSKTLAGLAEAAPKVIWRKHAAGEMGAHIWAPELHHIDGTWYIYFAAGRAERIWDIRIYVLSNDSPDPFEGEWKERGQLKTNWESFALDATTFEHRGRRYLVWAQNDSKLGPGTSLYIAEMESPLAIRGEQVRISRPELPWERIGHNVNEGAAILKRNGRLFLTYSASATDHNYCIGLLTASEDANLLDPASWSKSPQPVLATSETAGQFGPGHNSFTVSEDGKTDLMVYHARDYAGASPDPLRDPNRHTRIQPLTWRADGTPNFGPPQPAAEHPRGRVAPKPLFRDPILDGAADPVVIWNPLENKWFMFYTNRRANAANLRGVSWVHGTRIGIADSVDGGASWRYRGEADIDYRGDGTGEKEFSHWAPDVIAGPDGSFHMFLTFVPGMHADWGGTRSIIHLTSTDLLKWTYQSTLKLASDRVIDAAVARLPDGNWRLWYNEEKDRKAIYYADSPDLLHWTEKGKVIGDRPGEGPKVFRWKNHWWMIVDNWDGLGVYSSDDAATWTKQDSALLNEPGAGEDDGVKGGHADVVVSGDGERAFLFYFTHPGRRGEDAKKDTTEQRRSSIQVVELKHENGRLTCNRDAPTRIRLEPLR